ncbi:MAG: CinA family nicotinamide mononucleotide deamidase-related protein [Planctomycetes bacterium]|nr:CinA family nicotinamide mononucleotide deamidase-related protein [Planctomycetota bacterium]
MNREHRRAAILSIGDELTLGQTLNTNSRWLAERLSGAGVLPVEHVTVPDDLAAQTRAILRLAAACDLVVCSGGLGPTADDLTRQALAEAMGDQLVEDPLALEQVRAWYESRGREMPEINRVQALRPSKGQSLQNLHGTAPGLFGVVRSGGQECDVLCLPGPPGEMFPMFDAQLLPRLRPPAGLVIRTRTLHCFGIGESDLAMRLGALMDRTRNPLVGTTASGGVVSCRLRYEGVGPGDAAEAALDETERLTRAAAGAYVFGSGQATLAGTVLDLLRAKGQTLGCVESCTGGLLGAYLTEVPGSSAAFVGGLITYSNYIKNSLAGVPSALTSPGGPGAVSGETARAMAKGGLDALGCDHCLAVTGIAGPEGGSEAKPVGTVWIARVSRDGSGDVRRFQMSGSRQNVREWSAKTALAMLRFHLAGLAGFKMLREVAKFQDAGA